MPSAAPFVVLVPVKPPSHGKSRLAGLSDDLRSRLAAAFARDTILAARAAPAVAEVMVVTDDHGFARQVRGDGCATLPDGVTGDLNASLVQAALECRRRWPAYAIAALCADLPALRADDLTLALAQMPADGSAFVADARGTGTTMYAAGSTAAFSPAFGPSSRDAHALGGAQSISGPLASLRHDVDDAGDLGRALLLGVGPHTAAEAGTPAT